MLISPRKISGRVSFNLRRRWMSRWQRKTPSSSFPCNPATKDIRFPGFSEDGVKVCLTISTGSPSGFLYEIRVRVFKMYSPYVGNFLYYQHHFYQGSGLLLLFLAWIFMASIFRLSVFRLIPNSLAAAICLPECFSRRISNNGFSIFWITSS